MTDKSKWPQWLINADTYNARVEITPSGRVIWLGGTWLGGEWHGGVWRGGEWLGGEWCGGEWCGGVWNNGVWRGGVWHGGTWDGGTWLGGEWHGGEWHGGDDNPTRCMFRVRGSGDTIKVGCKSYSLAEAEKLCESGDLPAGSPSRTSEAGRLLRAAVLAQIAWQRALSEDNQ
jgi:hypothetical protein